MDSSSPPRFVRIKEKQRRTLTMSIDNQAVQVMEGDFLLTALMLHRGYARISDFSNSPRAGFCMMGACQDCWAWTPDGDRIRACTAEVTQGMSILTKAPEATWPPLR